MFQEVFALPSTESMIGQSFLACVAPQCRDEIVERSRRRAAGLPMVPEFETTALRLDGTQFPIHVTAAVVELPDGRATLFFVTDLSQRKRADEEIALLKRAIDVHVDAAFWMDTEGRITYANEAACKGLGFEPGELIGKPVVEVSPKLTAERLKDVWGALRREGFVKVESTHRRKDGSELPVEVLSSYVRFGGKEYACGFARDLTERKAAEQQRASLEAQLHHAQKMESIGRLAGGVAHDFNNMLSVILGNTELALGAVDPSDPLHADLVEIHRAAHRSADLTRQLLAFARKQTVVPKVLDLNVTLGGMLSMLRRLIGEDVELVWRPGGNLWPVKLDPSQIDQVLANLCVNARDAIAGVGRVTIETGNAVLDDAYCASRPGYMAGEYVRLAVSDDGCGMNEATLSQLFEPFFTTKTVGQGTGLGLATVYGIVRQNAGFIDVQSQPGMGTAFTIYLPRHLVESGHAGTPPAGELASLGHETILLVEDDPAVLRMSTRILTGQGYRVLGAGSPAEAVRIAEERAAQIHLLMTDVVMPEMNGRDLATKVLAKGPHIKCLFVSGYTADVIAHHGVLDEDVSFLHKPFSARALAVKVREVLGRG
jgi:PAS domain S-box-containing protein